MLASTKTIEHATRSGLLLTVLGLFSLTTNESLRAQEFPETSGHSVLELETHDPELPSFPAAANFSSSGRAGYRPAVLQHDGKFTPTALPLLPNSPIKPRSLDVQSPVSGAAFRQQEPDVPAAGDSTGTDESLANWTLKSVEDLKLSLSPEGRKWENKEGREWEMKADALLQSSLQGNQHQMVDVGGLATWVAPNLTYQPLLFEDARLERYGYASPFFAIQPIRSGLHFTNSSLLFPFRAWCHRHEMESPLAFERPGSYAAPSREIFVPAVGHR